MKRSTKYNVLIFPLLYAVLFSVVVFYVTKTKNAEINALKNDYEEMKEIANTAQDTAQDFYTQLRSLQEEYRQQEVLVQAAQAYALQREMDLKDQKQVYENAQQELNKLIVDWQNEYAKLENIWKQEAAAKTTAESKADAAVKISESLSTLMNNMRQTRDGLQKRLETAHNNNQKAETQVIGLNMELNQERAKAAQLESIRRRNEENIRSLENDIALLEQKYQRAMLASPNGRILPDKDNSTKPVRVPIRGEITDVQGDRAAISIGSSSGVRENMEFNVYRGNKFLGTLIVLQVESNQSAGTLRRKQGTIVKGDKVATGFD